MAKISIGVHILFLVNILLASVCIFAPTIPIVFPLYLGVVTWLAARKEIVLNGKVLLSYFVCAMFASSSFVLNIGSENTSSLSFFYFLLLYLPFIFDVQLLKSERFALIFSQLMLVVATFTLLQFLLQQVGFGYYYIGDFLPDDFLLIGYAPLYEYPFGSGIFKPNGFFLLEPSFLSQFMALGLVVEFYSKRRYHFILIFVVALLLSQSGTGILIVSGLIVQEFFRAKTDNKIKFFVSIVMLSIFILPFISLDFYASRATELGVEDSSAFIRFVAPFVHVSYLFDNASLGDIAFGFGPGSSSRVYFSTEANHLFSTKSAIEYGVFFLLAIHVYVLVFIFKRIESNFRLPLFVFVFLASGSLLQPITIVSMFLFQFVSVPGTRPKFNIF
ncbi:hypothetical protein [Rhodoferax aquaticus]|uniref:O-antigen ligase domain-containing protein n=1 Tax=Rhodoferax aquaticus TaxID=2527691 RepID=A0A515EPG0_9BURK|nr:hypothetical protein [Rhodoferax aquaticus]QDL54551.1 hypothetical protein EXZ61_10450 [Rhodoferax aquaticus]